MHHLKGNLLPPEIGSFRYYDMFLIFTCIKYLSL